MTDHVDLARVMLAALADTDAVIAHLEREMATAVKWWEEAGA